MTNPSFAPTCACGGACPYCGQTGQYNEQNDEFGRRTAGRRPPPPRPRPRPHAGRTSCLPGTVRGPFGACIRPALALRGDLGPAPSPIPDAAGQPVLVAVESPGGGRIRDKSAPRPDQIVRVPGTGGRSIPLHRHAATAWQALVAAARRDGIAAPLLLPTSGFRDPTLQARLYAEAVRKYGKQEAHKWVAPPGHSAHQSGRAIDFYLGAPNGSAYVARLRTLPAYHWLVANAARFGFYPYPTEPWHWEYNPPGQPGASPSPTPAAVPSPNPAAVPPPNPAPAPSSCGEIRYRVDPQKPFGPKWKLQRPPGLPTSARQTSAAGEARPHIECLAAAQGLGTPFVNGILSLADNETGGTFAFALPANIFNALPEAQRGGRPLITAWGVFQFNNGAWRRDGRAVLGRFPRGAAWDTTPAEEIEIPIRFYAARFREVLAAGGQPLDAVRGMRLQHHGPGIYGPFLRSGRTAGFAEAWRRVPETHRNPIQRSLTKWGFPAT